MSRKAPDWTKLGTVAGYAEWIRGKSEALCVVVIRRDDSALVADPLLAPTDAGELVMDHLPRLVLDLSRARVEKRKAGRLALGRLTE